ncbi:MAG: pentapeptide repeat-containing protein [Amaricoccus sp.]
MNDRAKAQIERITDLSQVARTSWIGLLAYLGFVCVTLLGVQDADFFVPSRETALPLIAVHIPTASFFWLAPLLAAALYVNLHLHLLKLWDAVAEAPARVGGAPLSDHLHSWFGTDLALDLKGGGAIRPHPMIWLNHLISRLLIWVAGPLVVAGVWWRSTPAHDQAMSFTIAVALTVMLYAGLTSYGHAILRLSRPWSRGWAGLWIPAATVAGAVLLAGATWILTERDLRIDPATPLLGALTGGRSFGTLTHAELAEIELVRLPAVWRPYETARLAFRDSWCKQEALPSEICDRPPMPGRPVPDRVQALRADWCAGTGAQDDCAARFAGFDAEFAEAWSTERAAERDNLGGLNLAGSDLRGARAEGATLVGASLAGARLGEADLRDAAMEGVDLRGAGLERALLRGADLRQGTLTGADFKGADLRNARLDGAMLADSDLRHAALGNARLDGAYLLDARLDAADLTGARLDAADLTVAVLDRADLRRAALRGADLRGARLEGADLRWTDLRDARWSGATLAAGPALYADLRGSPDLSQAQLDGLVGNAGTLLPDHPAPDTGLPYSIPSCWPSPPPGFAALEARLGTEETARLLCPPGEAPRPTGTPCPADTPRSQCPAP